MFLSIVVGVLSSIDWLAFWLINIHNDKMVYLSRWHSCMDGLFPSISMRTSGFTVVPLANIRAALKALYSIMM